MKRLLRTPTPGPDAKRLYDTFLANVQHREREAAALERELAAASTRARDAAGALDDIEVAILAGAASVNDADRVRHTRTEAEQELARLTEQLTGIRRFLGRAAQMRDRLFREANSQACAELMAKYGADLREVKVLGERLRSAVREALASANALERRFPGPTPETRLYDSSVLALAAAWQDMFGINDADIAQFDVWLREFAEFFDER